ENKTALFISHRLASTSFCDRIILLEAGDIVEEGTHDQLIVADGKYKELFDMQSCWYQSEGERGRNE
ncbi:MAG: ABC transporter ATP-binding protein, partial [Firmicutes bacterium]|nr:ABC transporter ATP-binding protein [Bacillota bacterium]